MLDRQEFYVLARSGEMVFYLNASDSDKDEQEQSKLLTASYLTGILQFAKAASGDIISNFELGKLDIWLKVGKELPLYYIYIVGKSVKVKKRRLEKYMSKIIDEFESRYTKDEINDWDGNLDSFNGFTPIAKKILKV